MANIRVHQYVTKERLAAGLSFVELGTLLGYSEATVRKCEKGEREFSLSFVLGCALIFGKPVPELFPALTKDVQDEVGRNAAVLDDALRNKTDSAAQKKLALLTAIISRTIEFPDV